MLRFVSNEILFFFFFLIVVDALQFVVFVDGKQDLLNAVNTKTTRLIGADFIGVIGSWSFRMRSETSSLRY